jgi:hypothetical protein
MPVRRIVHLVAFSVFGSQFPHTTHTAQHCICQFVGEVELLYGNGRGVVKADLALGLGIASLCVGAIPVPKTDPSAAIYLIAACAIFMSNRDLFIEKNLLAIVL